MKFLKKSIYALSLVSMMGLWSCSQDEMLQDGVQTPGGKTVQLTLTVNRGDAQTRTILSENEEGGLTSEWKTTDKLGVMISRTGKVGELEFEEYPDEDNKSVAVFSGTLTGVSDGSHLTMIYYCDESVIDTEKSTDRIIYIPLNDQKFNSVNELSAMDVLYEHVYLNINGGKANVVKDETMKPLFAMAHFNLTDISDEDSEGTLYVSQIDENMTIRSRGYIRAYSASDDLNTGIQEVKGVTELKAEVKSDHQVYMALPAVYDGGKYQEMTLSFRFVSNNGREYTYSFENPTPVEAGKYYCGKFENGKTTGVEIPMENVGGNEVVVDHSKNPLKKWAEGDLKYERSSNSNIVLTNHASRGSLYQWGRNVGWSDYIDALGTLNTNGVYYYGVYNESMDACNGWYDQYSDMGYLSAKYTQASNVRANPNRFLMDAYGSDYWVSSFGEGGSNWSDRAEKCGFTTPVAPDGYRLPTSAEFQEIWPTTAITTTATNLSNEINKLGVDLREIDDENSYIIKWELVGSGTSRRDLVISALVVPSTFTLSEITNDTWNDENVVVRHFMATGAIEAYAHTHTFLHSPDKNKWNPVTVNMDIARPMPFGTWDAAPLANDYTSYSYYYGYKWDYSAYTIKYSNIKDAGKTYEAGYWVSDSNMIFRYRDNQNKFGSDNVNSLFGCSPQPAQNAFAIRCIKVEE